MVFFFIQLDLAPFVFTEPFCRLGCVLSPADHDPPGKDCVGRNALHAAAEVGCLKIRRLVVSPPPWNKILQNMEPIFIQKNHPTLRGMKFTNC